MKNGWIAVVAIAVFVALGCSKDETPVQTGGGTDALPANLIAPAEPSGALDVAAAKKAAKDGEPIVIKGTVAGAKEPIAANRAIMTLLDSSIQTCDQMPGDTCATPWDACCEPADKLAANTASVQVVGADGKPLRTGLQGVTAVAPLKKVTVAGTAKITPGANVLVVEAKEIYVAP